MNLSGARYHKQVSSSQSITYSNYDGLSTNKTNTGNVEKSKEQSKDKVQISPEALMMLSQSDAHGINAELTERVSKLKESLSTFDPFTASNEEISAVVTSVHDIMMEKMPLMDNALLQSKADTYAKAADPTNYSDDLMHEAVGFLAKLYSKTNY